MQVSRLSTQRGVTKSPEVRCCAGFWTPAITRPSARSANRRLKSAKARSRGQLGAGWQRVLWGLCVGAELDGGREASTTPPACLHVPEVGRVQKGFRRALGAHQRAIDALMDVIGSSEIAAGVEPAHRNGKGATLTEGLAHDESILIGVGRHLGSQFAREDLDDDHASATERARAGQHTWRIRRDVRLLLRVDGRRGDIEESTGRCDVLGAVGGGKEPVVADAVSAYMLFTPVRSLP